MKYTFTTKQHGLYGADAAVFLNGVHVWTSPIVQAVGPAAYDTDRKKATRVAREYITDQKQIDSLKR